MTTENNNNNNDWAHDYQEFMNSDKVTPKNTDQMVLATISKLLNPNASSVFVKILGIHLAVGFLSLSVCHQFGINPFNTERSLADWMMNVGGHHFCMLGCGILFVGLSVLAAGFFLTIEEVNALKRTSHLQTLVLGLMSLGIFLSFGAEFAVGIGAVWLLGGYIGGFAATETVLRLKKV